MILIYPPGAETLALRIFNLLHYGYNAQISALCLVLLGLAVAPLLFWRMAMSLYRKKFIGSDVSSDPLQGQRGRDARMASGTPVLLVCAILWVAGCEPNSNRNEASISSQIFNGVQIIGSRGVGVGQVNKHRSVAVDGQDN